MNTGLDTLSMVGNELTDEQLDLAAGGARIYVIVFSDGSVLIVVVN
jgi:hypothetical protein